MASDISCVTMQGRAKSNEIAVSQEELAALQLSL